MPAEATSSAVPPSNPPADSALPAAAPHAAARVSAVVLFAWLAAVTALGAAGSLARPPGAPPVPIALAFAVPIVLFLAGVRWWPALREFALALDLRLITAIQAWRFAGLAFIALYVHGVLPGHFAWPAGLGDIAIAATAPWVLLALVRRPDFVGSRAFVAWNWLGILDLLLAVGTGALDSALATADRASTVPMAGLPLVLIPAYFVPIFVMLHVAALMQARRHAVSRALGQR